jgi:hypothetical protein
MFKPQLTSVVLASLLATAQLTSHAQTANPGASAATNAAIGGVSQGVVVAAVVGVAMVAAINSGSSGAVIPNPGTVFAEETAAAATATVVQAAVAKDAVADVIVALKAANITGNTEFTNAVNEAEAATLELTQAISAADTAKSDLSVASSVAVVGVVSNGITICAAANSCTRAELLGLQEKVAVASLLVAERTQAVIVKTLNLKAVVLQAIPEFNVSIVNSKLDIAQAAFAEVQTAANTTVQSYNTASAGTSGTVLTPSTGTIPASGTTGTTGSV